MESSSEYKESQIAKLLSYVRVISLNDISPLAVIEIERLLEYESIQGLFVDVDINIFKAVASELDEYPVGSQRSLWNHDSLKVKDREIEQIINFYRPQLLEASFKIIEAFENQDKLRTTYGLAKSGDSLNTKRD